MRTITVITLATAALLIVGCDSSGMGNSSSSGSTASLEVQNCLPLTQTIAFSGSATVSSSSAVSEGALALDVVTSVVNSGNSSNFNGSSSDGVIAMSAQGSGGLSAIQGNIQISSAAWNQALSQLGGTEGQCLQSMTFDLEVSDQTLYGGQVTLIVSGTQIVLAF